MALIRKRIAPKTNLNIGRYSPPLIAPKGLIMPAYGLSAKLLKTNLKSEKKIIFTTRSPMLSGALALIWP